MKKIFQIIGLFFLLSGRLSAATADSEIYFKLEENTTEKVAVSINIKNPSQQKIVSVQSWVKYDASILQGEKIETQDSPFDFVAPGENTFVEQDGLIKIGRSSISGGSQDEDVFVAKIIFKKLSAQKTELSFYDFQVDNAGHTSVRVFKEGYPVNVLKEAPQVLLIEGAEVINSKKDAKNIEVNPDLKQDSANNDGSDFSSNLMQNVSTSLLRPHGLKVTSGPGYILLSWDLLEGMKGYNIYYSNKSGRYLRRRSVGNVNQYYLDNLQTGKVYYLAITGYDVHEKETDYSDEVRIMVGYPNSSSAPIFLSSSAQLLNQMKSHVNSGPNAILFYLIIMASVGSLGVLYVRLK